MQSFLNYDQTGHPLCQSLIQVAEFQYKSLPHNIMLHFFFSNLCPVQKRGRLVLVGLAMLLGDRPDLEGGVWLSPSIVASHRFCVEISSTFSWTREKVNAGHKTLLSRMICLNTLIRERTTNFPNKTLNRKRAFIQSRLNIFQDIKIQFNIGLTNNRKPILRIFCYGA